MLCDDCGERMQRETVVLVMRVRGRSRSVLQPGWYCWTCRTSVHSPADVAAPEPVRGGWWRTRGRRGGSAPSHAAAR